MTATAAKPATGAHTIRPMCGAIKVDDERCKVFVNLASAYERYHVPTKGDAIRLIADDYGRTALCDVFDGVKNDSDPYTDYFDKDSVVVRPGDRNYDVAFAVYVKTLVHDAKITTRRYERNFGTPYYDARRHDEWVNYLQELNEIKL